MGKHDIWFNDMEHQEFVNFLVKKAKNSGGTVMNTRELIEEFKSANDYSSSEICLKHRISRFCLIIHEFPHFDTETKIKLMFGLGAPVDQGFLEELRKDAEVTVDDFDRIIHYKKNGGGLELKGKKLLEYSYKSAEMSDNQILKFLAKRVEEKCGILHPTELCKKFNAMTGKRQMHKSLQVQFRQVTNQIYESELFDENMKIRMMFATGTEVPDDVLKELRKDAEVTVDNLNRITHYKKNGRGGLELKGTHYKVTNDQLLEFLAQKVEESSEIMNITELCEEFQAETGNSLNIDKLKRRFILASNYIYGSDQFDDNKKIRMMFSTGTKVSDYALKELRKDAEVTVDNLNRITHYKKNGEGGLELKATPNPRKSKVNNDQILEFLTKKVEETNGIIKLSWLAKQLKAETGNSQSEGHLRTRIRDATEQIYGSELFDEDMKVRMMFATSTKVQDYALKELRKNAFVVVDKKNRIEEYKKKDGRLYLNRKNSQIKRANGNNTIDESNDADDTDEDVEEKHGDSSDDSEKEEYDLEVTTRSRKLSKKRFSDFSLFNNQDDMGHSSSRNERSKNSNNPAKNNKKRKLLDHVTESTRKKKETRERTAEDEYDNDYSIDFSYQYDGENRVKLEPFDGQLNMDLTRGAVINEGDDFVEEITAPIEHFVVPKYEEMLLDVKMEEAEEIILNDKEIKEEAAEDVMEVQQESTSLTTILESFHDFINILDIPIVSDLQKRIESKLEECRSDSKIQLVPIKELYNYLEVCLLKVNKNCEINKSVESFRLESFMIPFRHAVVTLKLPSLVEFQEKLKRIIGELRVQNKFIPVTAIRSALESVIYNILHT